MQRLVIYLLFQNILLLLLLAKDKNDGGRDLFRRQHWTASNAVLLILPMTLFILILYSLAYYLSYLMNVDLVAYVNKYYLVLILSFTTLLLIFIFRSRRQSITVLGVRREHYRKNIIIGISVSLLSYVALAMIFLFIRRMRPDFHFLGSSEVRHLLIGPLSYIIYFFAIVLWSPIVEESVYRGVLYSPFRKKYGPKIAIIVTSLLFSLIHFEAAIGMFLIGILLGVLYEKTESIVTPIAAHGSHNLLWLLTEIYFLS